MWNRSSYFVRLPLPTPVFCFGERGVNGTEVSRGNTVLREIARNIERIESGAVHDRVCLYGTDDGSHSCICYRDTGHPGRHQCPCGAEWK
jgi:hypothetical protein